VAKIVNMHEAKSTLSRLVEQAEAGEDIVIARAGKPAVRLVAVAANASRRLSQPLKGKITYAEGWDAPMTAEDLAAWTDGPIFPSDPK
jgi:prevent-host-death family protein